MQPDSQTAETPNPNLHLAQLRFLLGSKEEKVVQKRQAIVDELLAEVVRYQMAPFYKLVTSELGIPLDTDLLTRMTTANEEKVVKLIEQLEDAEKNAGESEVREAIAARADHYCRIGDKDKALEWFQKTFEKCVGAGTKLDVVFSVIRVGFFFRDLQLIKTNIDKARKLIEEGGDWDRRNRLKVYEATYMMTVRDFKGAAELYVDSLSTFNAMELMPYKEFIGYAIICSSVALDRVTIRKKVIDSPEVLEVIHELEHMQQFLTSLYNCEYANFFVALAGVEEFMKQDRYLYLHYRHYVREMRILAYAQLLESYRSVTLNSLAESFGVSEDFIDRELSRFIFAGRLNCKIDKVAGIVETNRPDLKNAVYQNVIKQGDNLLNRIQKLSRVINL